MSIVTITLNPCIDKTFSVERVVPDRKLSGENVRDYPGGGGINVARVVTRLGGDVCAYWSCGGDTGGQLAQLLDAEGVPHVPISIEDKVRENLIVTEASTGDQYRFGMPGPLLTKAELARWRETLQQLPSSVRYVVFSGSLPGNVSAEQYGDLLHAVPSGIRVVVDTKKDALRQALKAGVYLVKPNLGELEEIAGRELGDDEGIEAAARALIESGGDHGAEAMIVSLGRGGAIFVTTSVIERYSAPLVSVRSMVGAGDSMVGGLVTALDQGRPLEDAVRLGVAAGSAAVMTEGTELCRRDDTERLYRSVRRQESSPASVLG